jgi:hypothetical protein
MREKPNEAYFTAAGSKKSQQQIAATAAGRRSRVVTFRDPQLQKHCERAVSLVQGCPPDQIPVCALLDAWHWFHLTEGDASPRAGEAIEHLLSSELRPALRSWYHRFGADMNPAATEFRDRLGQLAGERFG